MLIESLNFFLIVISLATHCFKYAHVIPNFSNKKFTLILINIRVPVLI